MNINVCTKYKWRGNRRVKITKIKLYKNYFKLNIIIIISRYWGRGPDK